MVFRSSDSSSFHDDEDITNRSVSAVAARLVGWSVGRSVGRLVRIAPEAAMRPLETKRDSYTFIYMKCQWLGACRHVVCSAVAVSISESDAYLRMNTPPAALSQPRPSPQIESSASSVYAGRNIVAGGARSLPPPLPSPCPATWKCMERATYRNN